MKRLSLAFLIVMTLASCATIQSWFKPVVKYDQRSYESFTTLQAKMKMFVDNLKPDSVDNVESFYLDFNIVYEYEKGKGLENNETITQLDILRGRLDAFIGEASTRELSKVYRDAKKETLSRILDVIIATEYAKPR
jgi:hypothetical protein